MQLLWQEQAIIDLDDALAYISEDNPAAALKLVNEVFPSVEQTLSKHPAIGRRGRFKGTREWVAHKNYIVAYRVHDNQIQILAVMHSARLWPDEL